VLAAHRDGALVGCLCLAGGKHTLWPLPVAVDAPVAELEVGRNTIIPLEALLNQFAGGLSTLSVGGTLKILEQVPGLERDFEAGRGVATAAVVVERGPAGWEHGLAALTVCPR